MSSGRPKENNKTIQTSVRVSVGLHKKIKESAKKNFRSISDQIKMILTEYYEKEDDILI